jgi:hypothetical protein
VSRPRKWRAPPAVDAWVGQMLREDPGCFEALRDNRALSSLFKALIELGGGAPFSTMLVRAKAVDRRKKRSPPQDQRRLKRDLALYFAVEEHHRRGAPFNDNESTSGAYTKAAKDLNASEAAAKRAHARCRPLFEAYDYSGSKRRATFARQKTNMTT